MGVAEKYERGKTSSRHFLPIVEDLMLEVKRQLVQKKNAIFLQKGRDPKDGRGTYLLSQQKRVKDSLPRGSQGWGRRWYVGKVGLCSGIRNLPTLRRKGKALYL